MLLPSAKAMDDVHPPVAPADTVFADMPACMHVGACCRLLTRQQQASHKQIERSLCEQEGDPYPQYPDDADVPEGQSEVAFRVKAATDIKALGNDLYKKV